MRNRLRKAKKHRPFNARLFLYSFFVAFALYTLMLFVERVMLKDKEYAGVYVTTSSVDRETVITAENMHIYFTLQEREADSLPEGYITDLGLLDGKILCRDYVKNEVITMSGFTDIDERISGIEKPVEVSFSAGNLSQVAGGVLRAGDYINIWSVSEGAGYDRSAIIAESICQYAYVSRVFSASGEEVKSDDRDGHGATVINIIIPSEMEEKFNIALSKGTLRAGRCMYGQGENEAWENSN